MKTSLLSRTALLIFGACFLISTTPVSAQLGGVELVFLNNNPINLTAGDLLCFQLVAKDASGNVITDWNTSGMSVMVRVLNSVADTDTLEQSWSNHPDGYTWSRLTVAGQDMIPSVPHRFSVDNALFVNGVADACYQSTCAEDNVQITVTPTFANLIQISPAITVEPAALDNFTVDLTNQSWPRMDDYFVHRPIEIVVSPRDRYQNRITVDIPVTIEAMYSNEVQAIPGILPNPFDPSLTVNDRTGMFLLPITERMEPQDPGQRIRASLPSDPMITGISDFFWVNPHAPTAFGLRVPTDQSQLTLTTPGTGVPFQWEKPVPADPYTNVQYSRFSGDAHTDSTHYTIHFTDLAGTQDIAFDSFDAGQSPSFGIRQSDLAAVVDQLAGTTHTANYTLLWYVNATDGDYTTRSDPGSPNIPGNRLSITNTLFTGKGVGVNFAVQNPVILPAGGAVSFELQAMENGSTINDWDASGSDVTLMVKGTTVDTDTSTQSWNGDPDAYSWCRLTVDGQDITPSAPHQYTIAKSLFKQGRASVSYTSTKAESGVTLEIEPAVPGISQSSPDLSWTADTLENFLVDITWPDPGTDAVYFRCPFELVVTPRDRFLNPLTTLVATTLSSRFPGELQSDAGQYPSPYNPYFIMQGRSTLMLIPRLARDMAQVEGQWFMVVHEKKPSISGRSATFSVRTHAPYPFSLIAPADSTDIILGPTWTTLETFTWEKPDPADPYTDKPYSILTQNHRSDVIHYEIDFADPSDPSRFVTFTSDNNGLSPTFTTNHGQLAGVIDMLAGTPTVQAYDAIWYVRATDTLYTTTSTPYNVSFPGGRIHLTKNYTNGVGRTTPMTLALSQNYPNPFNPATTIRFVTTKRGNVSLKVYDLLGTEIAVLYNGTADAGEHLVTFDASKLRSGVYVYRLTTEGQTLSRRMVAIK
ncbi:MAG: T9SS type A sorting domain-containing protein [Bacteroidetes bacterium]|nr:T9SS type A sorting domain-containing protein [Bacteroidota bacterium]